MNYTIQGIMEGIAAKIASFSNRPIYIAPTQQKCETPCFYLCLMPGGIRDEIDNRYFSDINVDVIFLQQPNIVNATAGIYAALQNLDENLDTITYTEGEETTPMYVFNRKHHLEGMDLHYQISFHTRLMKSEVETYMKTLTEAVYVKKQN